MGRWGEKNPNAEGLSKWDLRSGPSPWALGCGEGGKLRALGTLQLQGSHSCPCSVPSKQRHNKLWKQQAESNLPQNTDSTTGSGDFLLESLDIDLENRLADLDMPSQSAYLDNRAGSDGSVGFDYCFRRLSDTLLENKIPGDREGFFHMEQLERDALVGQPPSAPSQGRLLETGKAPERAEPLAELGGFCEKEAKKKLDFSPRKGRMVLGAPGEDGVREENPMEKWKRRLSIHKEESRLNRENLNNNNSKRSCPEDFEVRMEVRWR